MQEDVRDAISRQVAMVAQLRHIVTELAATRSPAAQKAAHLRVMVSEHGALKLPTSEMISCSSTYLDKAVPGRGAVSL